MKFLLVQLLLISFICLAFTAKKEHIKKPRGLQNSLHDDYVRCKEECKKVEEKETTEKYIQYLRTELEAAELVAAQEQAVLQSTIDAQSNQQNEIDITNNIVTENGEPGVAKVEEVHKEATHVVKSEKKEAFAQEENLIV